jgi:hypothetical protein
VSIAADLRCAAQLRAEGADPAGSAGSHHGWVLVGWPLPWPADVGDIPELAAVRDVIASVRTSGRGALRLQALVPTGPDLPVVVHRRPAGDFAGYVRQSAAVPAGPGAGEALAVALAAILATPVPASGDGRDVLVCTHGRRDRCCGSFGTDLWQDLSDQALDGTLWRTSHTGGHRFAPTMVVLGEGTVWGFLDPDLARRVVAREGPVGDVLGAYRGCTGLDAPELQVLERAVLAEVGWSLLDTPRAGGPTADGRWELTVGGADPAVWSATVTPGARWAVPDCGSPAAGARKSGTALAVSDLRRRGQASPAQHTPN